MAVDDPVFPNAPDLKQNFNNARDNLEVPEKIKREKPPIPTLTPKGPLKAQGDAFGSAEMARQQNHNTDQSITHSNEKENLQPGDKLEQASVKLNEDFGKAIKHQDKGYDRSF